MIRTRVAAMKWTTVIAWIIALCAGMSAAMLGVMAWTQSRHAFDDEGRFFDGVAVHHEQTVLAYGASALAAGLLMLACIGVAGRARRRHRSPRILPG